MRNQNTNMIFFKDEIDRAYRVLGAAQGYGQNWRDIHGWKKEHRITDSEEKELHSYNRIREIEEDTAGNH